MHALHADRETPNATQPAPCQSSKIAQDNEFALYTVTIFRRIRDEFIQKCREEKFNVREFKYDEGAIEKQKREMEELQASEKELWVSVH